MNEIIMLIFTGIIAISTVIYTIYTSRLWTATKNSVDISRVTGFMNMMLLIDNIIKESKKKNEPESIIIEQLGIICAEFGFTNFIREIDFKDKQAKEYFNRICLVFEKNNIPSEQIPWLKDICEKLK